MNQVQALLIDTTGIQKYIFSTNKLKANIGASHIIANIYKDDTIFSSLEKVLKYKPSLDWENSSTIQIFDSNQRFEVGYIGGGNALFFFSDEDYEKAKALSKDFVKDWTQKLLEQAPGVGIMVAYQKVDALQTLTDPELYKQFRTNLMEDLAKNKSLYSPVNSPLHFGMNAPCKYTDLPLNIYYDDPNEQEKSDFVSHNVYQKLNIAKEANKQLVEELKPFLGNYTFETNQEKLGQKKNEKNYIAVSHIDGNGIGTLFEGCSNLNETRQLSIDLEKNIQDSFEEVVKELVSLRLEQFRENLKLEPDKEGKIPLPIRPIVISGDDITFVSEGRLGIYLTKLWIEKLKRKPVLGNQKVSYCAGVAIVNSNFPIQRAYTLANNACDNAKKKARNKEDKEDKEEQNWIDFHLQYGGFGGSLEEIREQFVAPGGNLISRPYQIEGSNSESSLDVLIEDARKLEKVPTSIRHELREVIWKNKEEQKSFLIFNGTRKEGSKIPFEKFQVNKEYPPESLFHSSKITHYLDMIELTEFYPWFLENKEDK
jgi:hypothetical protein